MRQIYRAALFFLVVGLVFPPAASAYITPGDASSCVQALIGSLLVALYLVRNTWNSALLRLKGRQEEPKK